MTQEKTPPSLQSSSATRRLITSSTAGLEENHILTDIEIEKESEKEREREKESERREYECIMPVKELGILMSILYRIQNILVLNSSHFEDVTLRFLQVNFPHPTSPHLSYLA